MKKKLTSEEQIHKNGGHGLSEMRCHSFKNGFFSFSPIKYEITIREFRYSQFSIDMSRKTDDERTTFDC